MGGFLILLALTVATLLWADLANPYVWIVLLVTVGFGLIGFFDDYRKLTSNSHRGLSGRTKLGLEIGLGAVACVALAYVNPAPLANTLGRAVLQNRAAPARLGLHPVWRAGHRRRLERGQPDRRARRTRHRARR